VVGFRDHDVAGPGQPSAEHRFLRAGPDDTTCNAPTLYKVTLAGTTATATSVLRDSTATDATSGKPVTLNLSDPGSNLVMPAAAPRFAGDLLLDSRGDSEQIFLAHTGQADEGATVLKLNTQRWRVRRSAQRFQGDARHQRPARPQDRHRRPLAAAC